MGEDMHGVRFTFGDLRAGLVLGQCLDRLARRRAAFATPRYPARSSGNVITTSEDSVCVRPRSSTTQSALASWAGRRNKAAASALNMQST